MALHGRSWVWCGPPRCTAAAAPCVPTGWCILANATATATAGPCIFIAGIPRSRGWKLPTPFRAKVFRGVYTVYAHPEDNALWVCTGDLRGECRILRTDDGFRSLEVIGAGDETWRAVNVHPVGGKICYASAGERLLNRVYRLDPTSGSRDDVGEVGGPVRDSLGIDNDLIFAVQGTRCNCNPEGEAALWHLDAHNGSHKLFRGCQTRDRNRSGVAFNLVRASDGAFWFSTRDPAGRSLQTFYARRREKD